MNISKEEDSTFRLGCLLSRTFVNNNQRDPKDFQGFINLSQAERKRRKLLRRKKQIVFEILLKKKTVPRVSRYEMPIQDRISAAAYERNSSRKTQEVLSLFEKLPVNDDVNKALEFILNLKDSVVSTRGEVISSIGDSISEYGSRGSSYLEFPQRMFEVKLPEEAQSTSSYKSFSSKMFQLELSYSGLFSSKPSLGLDGASVGRTGGGGGGGCGDGTDLVTGVCEDEGYNSPSPRDIWQDVLTTPVRSRSTWESLGLRTSPQEKPFLSEAGGESLHEVWRHALETLSLIDPAISIPRLSLVTTRDLTQHLAYLLAGIPSSSFLLTEGGQFSIRPGLSLNGISPECLEAFAGDFLRTGNLTKKLETFISEEEYSGKIVEGLRLCIRNYLRLFTNSVIAISKTCPDNLGQLRCALAPLISQVSFLAWVAGCDGRDGDLLQLPAGVSLLSRLLDVSVQVSDQRLGFLLLSLLSSCAAPYLTFLKSWLFSGELHPGDNLEFGIEMDGRCHQARDDTYWSGTYHLIPLEGSNFLADIQEKVHLTGKSLALLRLICPDHHLCGKYRDLQPDIKLAVTSEEQIKLSESFKQYENQLAAIAQECTDSYSQKKAKEEEEKARRYELIILNIRSNREKFEKEELKRREDKVKKQQQLYSDLQDQMTAVNERRQREKEEKKALERQIEVEAETMEADQRKREENEKKALEEFYANLNAEAERREKRLDWRKRRSDPVLKNKRFAILNTPAVYLPMPPSPSETPALDNTVKFNFDEMGNVSVCLEDQEGNIVSEIIDDLKELDESTKELLRVDNLSSLPENTGGLVRKMITEKMSRLTPISRSRSDIKARVLGSNINFEYDTTSSSSSPPMLSSRALAEADLPDGTSRRKASGSQHIERLLYPQRFEARSEARSSVPVVERTDFQLCQQDRPLPYSHQFNFSAEPQCLQEMGGTVPAGGPAQCEVSAPLTLILHNSILVPLRSQARLVNSALVNHLLVERQLAEHFSALRNYLLLADGEFGRQLVVSLCQLGQNMAEPGRLAGQLHLHLVTGGPPPHLLSPATLNRVLDTAINGSVSAGADPLSRHLTFLLDQADTGRNLGIPGLSLTYQAAWPHNIVLSLESLAKYSNILDFQLELRLALLSLELDWASENLGQRKDRQSHRRLLHKVSLMRHEMLNFLRNLRDYVASQILEISWLEFQDNLLHRVTCLDDLITVHEKYLNRALFRCLLNSKAAPVMKIVRDIFSSITRFSGIISSRLSGDLADSWKPIEKQYYVFKEYSRYFFKLVTKLNARGYQPHLQDLILRLNFNEYYDRN